MTLRDTIRSILQNILDWAKSNRDRYGKIRESYQQKLDEERKIARFKKEMEAKIKAEKKAAAEAREVEMEYEMFKGL